MQGDSPLRERCCSGEKLIERETFSDVGYFLWWEISRFLGLGHMVLSLQWNRSLSELSNGTPDYISPVSS